MRTVLLLFILTATMSAYAQLPPPPGRPLAAKDSLLRKITSELAIKKEVADSILSYIDASRVALGNILRDKTLVREERTEKLKAVSEARNAKIEQLLTKEQVTKLKAIMAEENKKYMRRPPGVQPLPQRP